MGVSLNFDPVVDVVAKGGPFVVGCVCGGWFSERFYKRASAERLQRNKLDADREKELLKQMRLKDDRIDALHKELSAARMGRNDGPNLPFTPPPQ